MVLGYGIACNWLFLWPAGMALATMRYLLRTLPVHRVYADESVVVPALPARCGPGLQLPEDGAGPMFHRRYRARIRSSSLRPKSLMDQLKEDPNAAIPQEVARFDGARNDGRLRTGDELTVRMPGPWEGPVRVVHTSATSFRLATLPGHPEAGQIEFHTSREGDDLVFEIESWARSGDRLAHLFYDQINLFKEVQAYLWAHYCERVCELSGGQLIRGIDIYTGRQPQEQT